MTVSRLLVLTLGLLTSATCAAPAVRGQAVERQTERSFDGYVAPTALVGATLINPERPPLPNSIVVIRDGRIACAGPRDRCALPADARVVDVGGAFIGPGLIDAHLHYSWTGWVDSRPDVVDVRARFPLDSVVNALEGAPERIERALLCSGVTSVFDTGGYPWTAAHGASREGRISAPRVASAGAVLTTRSSRLDEFLNIEGNAMIAVLRDEANTRAAARANLAIGARAIKVGYLRAADSTHALPLLAVAAEEAKAAGVPLIAHVQHAVGMKQLLDIGAQVLVHVVAPELLDQDAIAQLRASGAIVVPTLTVFEGLADLFAGRAPPPYPLDCVDPSIRALLEQPLPSTLRQPLLGQVRSLESLVSAGAQNVTRLRSAGVPMAVGTDAGNPGTLHGPSLYREMELLHAAGLSAREVFAAATLGGARVLSREHELGSIEAGKLADLVVFDADPTADVRNVQRIRWVMKAGALHSRESLLP